MRSLGTTMAAPAHQYSFSSSVVPQNCCTAADSTPASKTLFNEEFQSPTVNTNPSSDVKCTNTYGACDFSITVNKFSLDYASNGCKLARSPCKNLLDVNFLEIGKCRLDWRTTVCREDDIDCVSRAQAICESYKLYRTCLLNRYCEWDQKCTIDASVCSTSNCEDYVEDLNRCAIRMPRCDYLSNSNIKLFDGCVDVNLVEQLDRICRHSLYTVSRVLSMMILLFGSLATVNIKVDSVDRSIRSGTFLLSLLHTITAGSLMGFSMITLKRGMNFLDYVSIDRVIHNRAETQFTFVVALLITHWANQEVRLLPETWMPGRSSVTHPSLMSPYMGSNTFGKWRILKGHVINQRYCFWSMLGILTDLLAYGMLIGCQTNNMIWHFLSVLFLILMIKVNAKKTICCQCWPERINLHLRLRTSLVS
eukprot:GHVH01006898.1.p1 GENE.GHVH01006898.1~~GHVH01006898.1.p1  ORF type:complete len:421 (+),score=21.39 GHVH01006898.1:28-1290(+)